MCNQCQPALIAATVTEPHFLMAFPPSLALAGTQPHTPTAIPAANTSSPIIQTTGSYFKKQNSLAFAENGKPAVLQACTFTPSVS